MPAPEIPGNLYEARAASGHVNLMVDTLIANVRPDDLRAIMRTLLSTHSPSLATAFTGIARSRLRQVNADLFPPHAILFTKQPSSNLSIPALGLHDVLSRARSLYGAGMGFASLGFLVPVVRATAGRRWHEEGDMADALAMVDADICQAIQSAKEELEGGRVGHMMDAHDAVTDMTDALKDSLADVLTWGGDFPFERAAASLEHWKF